MKGFLDPAAAPSDADAAWVCEASNPDSALDRSLRAATAALRRTIGERLLAPAPDIWFEWGRASSLGYGVVQWWLGGPSGWTAIARSEPLLRDIAGETPFGHRVVLDKAAVGDLNQQFAVFLLPEVIAYAVVYRVRGLAIDVGLYPAPKLTESKSLSLVVRRTGFPSTAVIDVLVGAGGINLGAVLADRVARRK